MKLILVASTLVFALVAQSQTRPAPTPPAERIEVRLAQFDVVVRDKKGAIVGGLGADEFSVFEDGAPMEIVAVDEWGASLRPIVSKPKNPTRAPAIPEIPSTPSADNNSGSAEPERRSFILVFDALGETTALRMNQAKNAAANFVRAHLRPDDLAAVYQLDLSLRTMSGVTSNADDVARAIGKVTWMASSSLQDGIADSVLSSGSSGSAPLMRGRLAQQSINAAQHMDWQREHVYSALSDLASVFGSLPGRRILVLASPGFSMTAAGDPRTGVGGFTPKFREMIRSLAAYGVSVYTLDLGNDLAAGDVTEKIDWRVAVGKLGMDETTLSDFGLERSLGSSSASSRREFLGVIASETGGRLLAHTDLSKAFAAIEEESSRFYRISCRVPVTHATDRYRKLTIKLKSPGLSVASRKGRYSDITPLDRTPSGGSAKVESIDRVIRLASRGIAVTLPGIDQQKLPVEVVLEALGPIQLPTDAQGDASLDVEFRLVARAEDEIVDRYNRSFTATVKRDGVARLVNEGFRVEGRLSLVPGIYQLQGSIRLGGPPQLASWSAELAVRPAAKSTTPSIAGAILTLADDHESPLLSGTQLGEGADSLLLKPGLRILPTARSHFDVGSDLFVLFWLRGFPEQQGEQPPQLDLTITITDGEGRAMTAPTKILFFGKDPSGGYRAVTGIHGAELGAGAYNLRLSAGLSGRKESVARHDLSFTLKPKPAADAAISSSAPGP